MKADGYTKETVADLGTYDRKFDAFEIGDKIAVYQKVIEGGKERIQIFEGDVIAKHKQGVSSTFIVRKIGAHGVPVERIYPFFSPLIKDIRLISKGDVRRAKLYYVRDRLGKAARIKERRGVDIAAEAGKNKEIADMVEETGVSGGTEVAEKVVLKTEKVKTEDKSKSVKVEAKELEQKIDNAGVEDVAKAKEDEVIPSENSNNENSSKED